VARRAIRQRLSIIILLGVLTAVLSLVALMRALSAMSRTLRVERAREAVTEEVDRLARLEPSSDSLALPPATTHVGLRGGWVRTPDEASRVVGLPPAWRSPLRQTLAAAAETGDTAISEADLGSASLVLAAKQGQDGTLAWTAYPVPQAQLLAQLRWAIAALAGATVLLVTTMVWGAFSFRRSTMELHRTLVALGRDLTTMVPEPSIAELGGIADGIRRLAADLQTSRQATERLLRELAQKERLAALGRVAAGVAHEVRNPLASIKLRLDLTAASPALPDAARGAIATASGEIARLDRLVGDLLLVAGQKIGPRTAVGLGELVRARVDALAPWTSARRVDVRVDGDAVAHADPDSVARAVDNLLRNAVEASPAGATVRARIVEAARQVEVQVEDAGGGVEPARVDELFEPFFTTKAEGTGLGLAISRAIARAHGGDVVYGRSGETTRFSLTLPRSAAPVEAAA
jgi:signal transduction histidine kinase